MRAAKLGMIGAIFLLMGCGPETIDLHNDPSLDNVLRDMPFDEKVAFLQDGALITALRRNQFAIHGYTVEQVRAEAEIGRRFVAESNRNVLGPLIQELRVSGRAEVLLLKSNAGIYGPPEAGYLPKGYSLPQLEALYVENGGDLAALAVAPKESPAQDPLEVSSTAECSIPMAPEDAQQAWQQVMTDRAGYELECRETMRDMAIDLGGMPEDEATAHAESSCEAEMAFILQCMRREGAQPSDCFCHSDG